MKHLLIGLATLLSITVVAQPNGQRPAAPSHQNNLLNQSFWQSKPDVNAVKAEVEKGNSVSEMNNNSFDPIVMAINSDAPTETIVYMINLGGNDVNKLTHDSRTYIFWAAYRGNLEVMKYVLSKGAKTDLKDSHGASPLTFAAGAGVKNTAVYDLLVTSGINLKTDLNNGGANALLLTVGSDNDLTLTNYFQSKGLDIKSTDESGNNAFNYAARAGNMEVMKKLLDKGVKPTKDVMVFTAMGSRRGSANISVFQYLETLGAKANAVNKEGNNALHYLVRRPGQTELINYFLSKGADVNQVNTEGNTVFMNAAASNNELATIQLLAQQVKNINLSNKAGNTALSLAVNGNSAEVVKFLVEKGADVKVIDAKGNNLAYYLVDSYRPQRGPGNASASDEFGEKLKLLQGKGLNLATAQKDGNTLYHLAMTKSDLELFKKIAPLGADINAKNSEGVTVLHKAALVAKNDAILRYLLEAGAKKDIKTGFDETAYDLALENDFLKKANVSVDFLK